MKYFQHQRTRYGWGVFLLLWIMFMPPSLAIPIEGLIAYYPFNGNANDASGDGHHGTVNGATLTMDRFGKLNHAYHFDGVDDFITIKNADSLNPQQITVSAWYLATQSFVGNGNNVIIHKPFTRHTSPYYQWHLGVGGDLYKNRGIFYFNSVAFSSTTTKGIQSAEVLNQWYHVVVAFDGTTSKLYLNGKLARVSNVPVLSQPAVLKSYATDVFIGKHGNLNRQIDHTPGSIDDIRIYNRALSETEVQELFAETEPQETVVVEPPQKIASLVPSQSVYQIGDTIKVVVPPVPAGQDQYVGIALPDGTLLLSEQLGSLQPFDGQTFRPWRGESVAFETPVTADLPQGEYTLYLLRTPQGADPMNTPDEQWLLGKSTFIVGDATAIKPEIPRLPGIAQLIPLDIDKISLAWLPANDDKTAMEAMRYEVHLSQQTGFEPSANTLRATVTGDIQAEIRGLTQATTYYVLVLAIDEEGHISQERNYREISTFSMPLIKTNTPFVVDSDVGLSGTTTTDGATFTYSTAGANLPAVGTILLIKVEDSAYLRKILSINRSGNGAIVETEEAGLADVFEQGQVMTSETLFDVGESMVRSGLRQAGTGCVTPCQMHWQNGLLSAEQIDYVPQSAGRYQLRDNRDTQEELQVKAEVKFEPEFKMNSTWQRITLKSAEAVASGTITFEADVAYDFAAAGVKSKEIKLFSKKFKRIYLVGNVPVYQETTFSLNVLATASAMGQIKANANAKASATVKVGTRYSEASGWQSIPIDTEFNRSVTVDVGIQGEVQGEIRLIPNIQVAFYKVLATDLSIEPYIKANLTAEMLAHADVLEAIANPQEVESWGYIRGQMTQFDLFLKAEAFIMMNLRAFGKTFSILGKTRIWDSPEWKLFSLPKLEFSQPYQVTQVGVPLNLEAIIEDGANNPVDRESVRWTVYPPNVTVWPDPERSNWATFNASEAGIYRVFLWANSRIPAPLGRQFTSVEIAVEPSVIDGGDGGFGEGGFIFF